MGISLLLWNCEKEENEDFIDKQNLLENLKSKFNPKDFEKTLSYQYQVNWENPQKQYSEELKTNFYEFPIIYTSSFNPNELSKKKNKEYLIKYKIIVTEKEPNKFDFYIGRFYKKNEDKKASNINFETYFNVDKGYIGFTHLIDKNDDLVFAKKIEQTINPNRKIFTNKEFRDTSLKNKMPLDCYEVPVYHYTDWYYNGSYARTVLNEITYETVCYEEWLPDLPMGEGVGAGTYSGTGNGNNYSECTTDKCKYKIGDKNSDCGNGFKVDINGNCVEDVPQVFNELTGKDKCIYEKLKNLNLFKSTIKKFENSSNYDLTIKKGDCNNTNTACTDGSDINNGNITITMEIVSGTLPLEYAATILHEGIHAELFKYVNEHQNGIDPNNRENLLYHYFEQKKIQKPSLVNSVAQHQHMADKYVKPIAEAIRQLDNNQYPLEYYKGFAWDGLRTYGYDGYYNNGNWVNLNKDQSTEYYKKQKIVNDNTKLKGNECK